MSDLRLTVAVGDYDQTRDLALGRVRAMGIDLTVLNNDVEEIFYRFHDRLEWEVSELSMGMYTSAISRGDNRFIAIPVFPSRVFRHSAIYIRPDGKIRKPEDLAGKRIGCAQWSQTAAIYVRGYLAETVGVPLSSIDWIQAGVNDAGREEPSILRLPENIKLKSVADRTLNDMLLNGEIDAAISARPPRSFTEGSGRIVRLFPEYRLAEEDYFRQTKIFPIMHTIAIRRDVYEANRWIARNLFKAFQEAKQRSVARMLDATAAHVPLPWSLDLAERAGRGLVFESGDFWPYGVTDNRATLSAFLRFTFDQGTTHRKLSIEEIFAEEALAEVRV
jgi:4,5-dihydroxyphthalate decarboxylase